MTPFTILIIPFLDDVEIFIPLLFLPFIVISPFSIGVSGQLSGQMES